MPVELCVMEGCGKPSESVVVIVTVSLLGGNGTPPAQAPLCGPHGRWFAGVVRRMAGGGDGSPLST